MNHHKGFFCREEGIRTLDTVTHILAFQASSLNHSDTSLYWSAKNTKKTELEKQNQKLVYILFLNSSINNFTAFFWYAPSIVNINESLCVATPVIFIALMLSQPFRAFSVTIVAQ